MILDTHLEVLAPAGSLTHLEAALRAGADAVYVGIKGMSARPDEWSFALPEVEKAVAMVHAHNRRLYCAFNAEVGEYKANRAALLMKQIANAGCDALIISDWGLIERANAMQLGVPVHASTLLGVYNISTVNLLHNMGVTRVILNTNLRIEEIAQMTKGFSAMEYEILAFGGICFNDNRRCRLPHDMVEGIYRTGCKKGYEVTRDAGNFRRFIMGHPDIDLSPVIGQYISLGITSFKIEGRTRDVEYISRSTTVMRRAIDEYLSDAKLVRAYCYV